MDNLKDYLIDLLSKSKLYTFSRSVKSNISMRDLLIRETSYLNKSVTISERVFNIINDLNSKPVCKICKCETGKFISYTQGYSKYCNSKCQNSDPKKILKTKNTCMEKYGVDNPSKLQEFKNKIKKTCMEKYGFDHPMKSQEFKNKIKKTCMEKYGVDHPSKTQEFKNKIRETCIHKYGVDHPSKTQEFKNKIRETCMEKYGEISFSKTKEFRNLMRENSIFSNDEFKEYVKKYNVKKHGVEYYVQSEDFKKKSLISTLKRFGVSHNSKSKFVKDKKIMTSKKNHGVDHPMKDSKISLDSINKFKDSHWMKIFYKRQKDFLLENKISLQGEYISEFFKHNWTCTKCNSQFIQTWASIQQGYTCIICNPRNTSKFEIEIYNFLLSIIDLSVLKNSRNIIPPKELDIYIPSKNIAIEFNGLYWHSEEMMGEDAKNYHLNKTNKCKELGIQLIQIFEDEWVLKQDIVKSKLKNILNVKSENNISFKECTIKEIDHKIKNEFLNNNHIQGKANSDVNIGSFYKEELISIMTFSKRSQIIEDNWELNRFCSKLNYQISGMVSKLLSHFKKNYKWKEIFSYVDRRWSEGDLHIELGFKLSHVTKPNYWYVKGSKRIHRGEEISECSSRQRGYRIWDCGNLKYNMDF